MSLSHHRPRPSAQKLWSIQIHSYHPLTFPKFISLWCLPLPGKNRMEWKNHKAEINMVNSWSPTRTFSSALEFFCFLTECPVTHIKSSLLKNMNGGEYVWETQYLGLLSETVLLDNALQVIIDDFGSTVMSYYLPLAPFMKSLYCLRTSNSSQMPITGSFNFQS